MNPFWRAYVSNGLVKNHQQGDRFLDFTTSFHSTGELAGGHTDHTFVSNPFDSVCLQLYSSDGWFGVYLENCSYDANSHANVAGDDHLARHS